MKVYKLEVIVIDHDGVGDDLIPLIENQRYPNDCLNLQVLNCKAKEIGEWEDDHPLNRKETFLPYIRMLFPDPVAAVMNYRKLLRDLLEEEGCYDRSCILRENHGMVTNGGCTCRRNLKEVTFWWKNKNAREALKQVREDGIPE